MTVSKKKQVTVYHLSHVDSARKHPFPREVQLGSVKRYSISHATLFQTQLSMIYNNETEFVGNACYNHFTQTTRWFFYDSMF